MMISKGKVGAAALAFAWVLVFVSIGREPEFNNRQLGGVKSSHPFIDESGTLQIHRKPEIPPCRFFTWSKLGDRIEPEREIKAIHYHFDDCAENQLGNRLGEHYMFYLLANSARLPYQMSCGDPKASNDTVTITDPTSSLKGRFESVLRNIAVDLQEPGPVPKDPWGGQEWGPQHVCQNCARGGWWCQLGLHVMVDVFVPDMKKLAYDTEIGNSFEPEDAVIHLRLGDALKGKKDENIGLLPHGAYIEILEQIEKESGSLKSIGVVTQPFKKKLVRSFDATSATLAKSRLVAFDLIEHIRSKFPQAIVSIHNGDDEIPLKSYARLIRAKKVAICGASTFCTMPVLATEGKGYLFRGEKHSPWAQHVADFQDNIRTFKVPRLANNYTDQLNDVQLLHWLRYQLPHAGEFAITGPPMIRNKL